MTYVYKTNLNTNILDMRYNFLHNHKRLVLKEVHVKKELMNTRGARNFLNISNWFDKIV